VSTIDVSSGAAYAGREANHALSFRQFNKSKHAQYFTPLWLADLLFDVLQPLIPSDGPATISVLDPTCGSGRLLAPWKLAGAEVLGIELDELAADHARFAVGAQNVRTGDVLDYRHLLKGFSLIVHQFIAPSEMIVWGVLFGMIGRHEANVRQVAIPLRIVHAVADHEEVGNRKSHVVRIDLLNAS